MTWYISLARNSGGINKFYWDTRFFLSFFTSLTRSYVICRLYTSVSEAEVERAKQQLKASLLLCLDGTTAVAEDVGRQLITTGKRLTPEDVDVTLSKITVDDIRRVAGEYLWDQDVAVVGLGPGRVSIYS